MLPMRAWAKKNGENGRTGVLRKRQGCFLNGDTFGFHCGEARCAHVIQDLDFLDHVAVGNGNGDCPRNTVESAAKQLKTAIFVLTEQGLRVGGGIADLQRNATFAETIEMRKFLEDIESEGCLIPRPETEELVSRIIDDLSGTEIGEEPFNILDLCTGSGCIAWSLAAAFPEAMVYGCDLSDAALRYACRQRVKVGGAKPIFFTADVLSAPPAGLPKFDVIVSNPPYICDSEKAAMRPNVLDFEPSEALFVPDDDPLVFYRAIARWAGALLRPAPSGADPQPAGRIYLEINERFGPEVAALFPNSRLLQDISGRDRFVVV